MKEYDKHKILISKEEYEDIEYKLNDYENLKNRILVEGKDKLVVISEKRHNIGYNDYCTEYENIKTIYSNDTIIKSLTNDINNKNEDIDRLTLKNKELNSLLKEQEWLSKKRDKEIDKILNMNIFQFLRRKKNAKP